MLVPVVAGITAALRGDARAARLNAHRRARAWLSDRVEVDTSAETALAFTAVIVEAMLGDPVALRQRLRGVTLTDANGLLTNQAAARELLDAWARVRLGEPGATGDADRGMAGVERSPEQVIRAALRTFLGEAQLEAGEERAVATLAQARAEAEARG